MKGSNHHEGRALPAQQAVGFHLSTGLFPLIFLQRRIIIWQVEEGADSAANLNEEEDEDLVSVGGKGGKERSLATN